ncbi:isochorismatase family protein [Ferruginivarius sediminum]|uniref:Isochorismatase family protein n=1 Tax=Ferruginivarius sediminum TaxID=2661937 RepID=A0A369T5I5_9PROT|nr:isochorismatase family protein [Ferruginivarius sediminum]RDD60172.1 isochorismatase family protein [Ferruginivarius sediminum]
MAETEHFELYDVAGYGYRKIGFGKKIGIVSIDFMIGVTKPEERMGQSPLAQTAVENTAVLLNVARKKGLPIVHCNTAFQPDHSDMPPWKIECMRDWILGSRTVEIDERLWSEGDVLVCKKTPSIFFGTHCASVLNMHGVDTVIITGANTSGCIRASTIDSFAHGYRTIIPRECVFDQGSVAHEQNLIDVGQRYADVESFDAVLEHLNGVQAVAAE